MNKFRPFILCLAVVASALLAYGLFTQPSAKPSDAEGFSSARVVQDIEIISKEHHSVANPQEREVVREYLIDRLVGLGADTVEVFRYDSLVGPQNRHVEYVFDAYNVLAEFAPLKQTADTTYLMLVAHYDSRYSQPYRGDYVWSYGAADDGYGLGVILETVSQLLKERDEWSQGVKVLFTDAEEVGMMGMKMLWEKDRHIFDNVGLMINVEARGPMGPVLLFETSPGNDKLVDLYASAARFPYTYSLTTVVYRFMPNFTDFTIVKDSIPGMNFSTIADVNHYHTHLDNFGNINEKTIQHYGEQILPVASEYLKSDAYADKDALRSSKDSVNFTIPALGLIKFSKAGFLILNIIVSIFFMLLFALEGIRGRVKAQKVCIKSLIVLGCSVGVLLAGEIIAFMSSLIAGVEFKPFGTIWGIEFDNWAMIISVSALFILCLFVYMFKRAKAVRSVSGSMRASAALNAANHHAYNALYGTLALMFVLCAVLGSVIKENMMFLIPWLCATAAMALYHLTNLRVWLLAAMVIILLHAFSFLYALSMALTIGALGAVMMLAFIDFMVLIPLADLYMMPARKH